MDFDPALGGCFGFGPRAILGKSEVFLVIDAFSHQSGHDAFGGFILRGVHSGRLL